MAITFPTSAAKPEYIRRGAGDFYIGAYVAAAADMADIADRPRLYLFQHQAWQFMMYIHIFLSSVSVVFFSGHP